jgi:hypothetical protein
MPEGSRKARRGHRSIGAQNASAGKLAGQRRHPRRRTLKAVKKRMSQGAKDAVIDNQIGHCGIPPLSGVAIAA